jgi:hypothetical protein
MRKGKNKGYKMMVQLVSKVLRARWQNTQYPYILPKVGQLITGERNYLFPTEPAGLSSNIYKKALGKTSQGFHYSSWVEEASQV